MEEAEEMELVGDVNLQEEEEEEEEESEYGLPGGLRRYKEEGMVKGWMNGLEDGEFGREGWKDWGDCGSQELRGAVWPVYVASGRGRGDLVCIL